MLAIGLNEGPLMSFTVILNAKYHFSGHFSFRDFTTFLEYTSSCNCKKSFIFNMTKQLAM